MENLCTSLALLAMMGLCMIGVLICLGSLLLCDLIFKTSIGRRTCRWFFNDETM